MNFLAHLSLSDDEPKLMVGNFIGDFVRGRNLASKFEPMIVTGIELHRAIDHFTDTHKIVRQSKKRLAGKYGHYSGVIVDVFYDHYLSAKWTDYYPETISAFAARAYKTLHDFDAILPEFVKGFLPYMVKQNWLVAYGSFDGLQQALTGIGRRTHISNMADAINDLKEKYKEFDEDFSVFFPQLKEFAHNYVLSRYPEGY
ncbi:MAG TPA: ACP phosphodiesterase [Cyclobacteriaceae bacterium]